MASISVFGLGYVGSVSVACLADNGHSLIGVDVSQTKVEMIEEGRTGLLFPAQDAAALAKCIERLLEDPEQVETLGRQARERIGSEGLLAKDNARRHLALYRSLLEKP